ncbi:MAG: 2-amino-4-hydroxy-6-hydroxymethyldihydropteridine diphosphokinase [Pyrinomonadaceae bacterium]
MTGSSKALAYVSLGSNLGDRACNLLLGIRGIMEAGLPVTRLSSIYESEPVETFAQPHFLNMVAELGGNRAQPDQMMARLLRVEFLLGRTRTVARGPRVIDLDLLLFGDHTSTTELLTLPHPRMHLRRFVLEPLAELAPALVHPTLQQTIASLLENLDDRSQVKRWPA